jgi:hypothetical protein
MEVSQASAMNMGMGPGMGMGMGMPMGGPWVGPGVGVPVAGFHGWGGFCPRAAERADMQARARVRTQERIRGTMSATVILQAIDEAAADLRVAMTQKYGVEF